MKYINSYKFRIYPTSEQEEQLFKTIGCARLMYNLFLNSYNKLYADYKKGILTEKEYKETKKRLLVSTFKKDENYSFLGEVDSIALGYSYRHTTQALSNFYKGHTNPPNFKSKSKSKWSYTTCRSSRNARNLRLEKGGWLVLPKIPGRVKISVSRNPKGVLVSVTITKTRSGKWFVSLSYEQHIEAPVFIDNLGCMTNPIGLDLGVKDLAITSDGKIFNNPKHARRAKKKLARIDKSFSRKREQAKKDGRKLEDCKNYQKQKVKRARAHENVKNQREDGLHKATSTLIKNHDFVAVEDLSASNLMKNHKLAFSISDASWCSFLVKLKYKAERNGKTIQVIDRFYASTQLCSECEEKSGPCGLPQLNVREWTCEGCGVTHDRDVNAAKNILAKGIKDFLPAGTAEQV